MSDGSVAAWVHVGFEAIGIVGGMLGTVGGMAVLLARRTFVTRDELGIAITEHAVVHQKIDDRLNASDGRFIALQGSIDKVASAAQEASNAAEKAATAGNAARDAAHTMSNDIAELHGEIKALDATMKPIERLTMDMVEAHMAGSLKPRGTR